jgi:hypothetical protein
MNFVASASPAIPLRSGATETRTLWPDLSDIFSCIEVFVANEYRAKNPDAQIRLINWDPPMTHYGHLELPKQLAAAHFSVVRWLVRP